MSFFRPGSRYTLPIQHYSECGSPNFNPTSGMFQLPFLDATILGGDTCIVSVDVTAASRGIYGNSTSQVTSSTGHGNQASDTLYVGEIPFCLG